MPSNPKLPVELHDLLNALRQKSGEGETEQLLIATVLKLADELADLRMKLRRVV